MNKSQFNSHQRKLTISEVDKKASISKNSTLRLTTQEFSIKPIKSSEKFKEQKYFIGQFPEKKFTVTRKFLTNPKTTYQLHYSEFAPHESTHANLIVVHGWLASSNFFNMAEEFAKKNIAVHLFDLSGFGFSQGITHNETLDVLVSDLVTVIQTVGNARPLFLYGHALGALIILRFLVMNNEFPFQGVMVSSPMIDIPDFRKIYWLKNLFFSKIIGRIFGSVIINSFMNPTAMTKDNNNIKALCDPRFGVYELGQFY